MVDKRRRDDETTAGPNAPGAQVPKLDLASAPLADIEALFRSFGTQPYELHQPLLHWLTTDKPRDLHDIR